MSCNGWKRVKLEDVINFNPKESIKKGKVVKKISMDKLETFTRKISGYEECAFTSGTKFRNGDTLLARITPCLENGKTAQVDILEEDEVAYGSTEFIVLREKEGVTLNNYIYYLAISPQFRQIAIKSMNGSSGRQRVQKDILDKTEMYLPCIEEQKKISDVLSSLDTKIELNNEMNKTLEEMAQALFKRWFVDFEYTDEEGKPYKSSGGEMVESEMGMIPKGWKVKKIEEMCDVKGGKRLPKGKSVLDHKTEYPYIRVTDVTKGYVDVSNIKYIDEETRKPIQKYIINYEDVYISIAGTVGLVGTIVKELDKASLTENMARIITTNVNKYLLKLYMNSEEGIEYIKANTVGSTQPKLPLYAIKGMPIVMAPKIIESKFSNIINALYLKIEMNLEQSRCLTQLRDSLLPKLMSGEIRVNDRKANL